MDSLTGETIKARKGFVLIYEEGFEVLSMLSPSAAFLVKEMVFAMRHGSNRAFMTYKTTKLRKNTYYEALKALKELGVVKRVDNEWLVNPNLFWKGDIKEKGSVSW